MYIPFFINIKGKDKHMIFFTRKIWYLLCDSRKYNFFFLMICDYLQCSEKKETGNLHYINWYLIST
ncbi:unnamed protein product [Larinioides sclopetarius]|uniref:Uncharacterized protein n=1 Tax=Larinioides sclopetarius TaxID=280406 RepID=A0AAV1Z8H4_9ARAC